MLFQKYFSTRATPQTQPIAGAGQVVNSAGGYAWAVDNWTRLDRFLVLGTEGGAFYISERALTVQNAQAVAACLQADGLRTVARIVAISEAGRAPKNDPAIFALAMAASLGDAATRRAALAALPQVARTGTHLFLFLGYAEALRGWGRGLRRAVASWYTGKPAQALAYQAVKYQQRDGWSHRDALRLAHPQPPTDQHAIIFHWMAKGWEDVGAAPHPEEAVRLIWALERAKRVARRDEMAALIQQYDLPWEAVPSQWLGEAEVWRALLPKLPLTALLRNLARMTANGLLRAGGEATDVALRKLQDDELLRRTRIHPVAVLAALNTYAAGHGMRGALKWTPIPAVIDALDRAFYGAFGNVEATGKRIVLALDVSASMDGGLVAGVPGLTPRVAAAAMALVTAAVEPHVMTVGFSHAMVPLAISSRQRLDDVVTLTRGLPFGGTDCAKPMIWALKAGVKADAFVIYTDSETWFGQIHPVQALQEYRRKTGIPAKLVVVAMTSNGFTIADPNDAGMLDVVGFDAAAPQVISGFISGE
jgi:60 kDa SS-A/Ro ribonucleoprotein